MTSVREQKLGEMKGRKGDSRSISAFIARLLVSFWFAFDLSRDITLPGATLFVLRCSQPCGSSRMTRLIRFARTKSFYDPGSAWLRVYSSLKPFPVHFYLQLAGMNRGTNQISCCVLHAASTKLHPEERVGDCTGTVSTRVFGKVFGFSIRTE